MSARMDWSKIEELRPSEAIDYAQHPRKAWDKLERVWVLGWVLKMWRTQILPLLPDLRTKKEREEDKR